MATVLALSGIGVYARKQVVRIDTRLTRDRPRPWRNRWLHRKFEAARRLPAISAVLTESISHEGSIMQRIIEARAREILGAIIVITPMTLVLSLEFGW